MMKTAKQNDIVKKSNVLVRGKWQIENIYEPRLVALTASRVRKTDKDFKEYAIELNEIVGNSEIIDGRTYDGIKKASKQLMMRVIEIKKENGWAMYNVFTKIEYNKKGCVYVQFHPDMKEHYLNLSEYFTQYSLYEFLKLPSTYSQRLFEILKSWDDKTDCIIDIEELQEILFVPASHKKDFRNFRIRVLEKAYKDIHEHTSLKYEYEAVKNRRKVIAIRFIFNQKKINELKAEERRIQNNKLVQDAVSCHKNFINAGTCNEKECDVCNFCKTRLKISDV